MAPADNGVTVVGTPIGCDDYVRGAVQSKVVEQQSFTRAIMALPSSQVSWLLFLYCAVPRVNHLLRTIPPGQASAIAAQHDQLIAHAFSELLGLSPGSDTDAAHGVSRDVWERQARLPLTLGGCGLRSSARTSPAAFWASLADCLPVLSRRYPQFAAQLVASLDQQTAQPGDPRTLIGGANEAARFLRDQGFEAMPSWDLLCGGVLPPDEDGDEAGPDEDRRGWQGRASRVLEKAEHESLLVALAGTTRQGPLPGRARLRSCSGPHAGAWLATIPSTDALRLSNPEFLCALRRRLGLATGGAREHCEGCGRAIDPHGHHRTACGRTGRYYARHKCVVAAWRQVFQEAGGHVPVRNVQRMLRNTHVPVDPRDARRLDLLVTGLSVARGLPLFVDATFRSPITGTGVAIELYVTTCVLTTKSRKAASASCTAWGPRCSADGARMLWGSSHSFCMSDAGGCRRVCASVCMRVCRGGGGGCSVSRCSVRWREPSCAAPGTTWWSMPWSPHLTSATCLPVDALTPSLAFDLRVGGFR